MEMQMNTTAEAQSRKRRLNLPQLLWIGLAALVLFLIEVMLWQALGSRASLWTVPIAGLGWLGIFILLYCFVEHLKHCSNPLRFILWLFCGGIAAGLLLLGLNLAFGVILPVNYAFEYTYILLFVLSINSLVEWKRSGFTKRTLLFPAMLALTIGLHYLCQYLGNVVSLDAAATAPQTAHVLQTFFSVLIFPSAWLRMLAPLACIWYFTKNKRTHCWALAAYCLFAQLVYAGQFFNPSVWHGLFNNIIPWLFGGGIAENLQIFGILAIPFILGYEHREGAALSLKKHGFLLLLYPLLVYAIGTISRFFPS